MRKLLCLILMLALACVSMSAGADGVVTPSEPDPQAQGRAEITTADGGTQTVYGDLEELIGLVGEGEIFVRSKKAVKISDIDARLLVNVRFLPDPEVFTGGDFAARLTFESPDGAEDLSALEDIDLSVYEDLTESAPVTVYVWVMQILPEPTPAPTAEPAPEPSAEPTTGPTQAPQEQPTAEPTPEPTAEPTPEPIGITVSAEGVVPGDWSAIAPVFTLGGIPQGRTDLAYAVILYDREIAELDGNVFQPQAEGVFSLRFVIVDAMGDILSASESTTLYLDFSAPEFVSALPSQQKSYAMVLTAADSLSGVSEMSVDSGATWTPIENEIPLGHVFGAETTLLPGILMVKDAAGNVWTNEEPLVFPAVIKMEDIGGGYYGPVKPHAENTTDDDGTTGYAEVYLNAAEEPVAALDIAGRELALKISVAGEETPEALFSVQFGRMPAIDEQGERAGGIESLHAGMKAEADDMMLLTAVLPDDLPEGEHPVCTWSFDGAALRTLRTSGVESLVLCAGDSAAVFPTVGFTAGTRYTDLKIGGTGSRFFLYMACMQETETRLPDEINRTEHMSFALTVSVKEEEFELVPAAGEEMYAEGVSVIPAAWLDLLPEEYPALETENE